jgi:D-3-phosphoglycerate dehydrogenase
MPHILVAGKIHPAGIARLEAAAGITFEHVEPVDEASYVPRLPKADAIVIRTQPLTAATIAAAPRLRIVSRHGVGYDSVDVAALDARGIPLTIVGDVNSLSVAEQAMMLILAAAKRAVRADRAVRDPALWGWRNRLEPREITGRTLLIVGYGRAGRHLARMAAGFSMRVLAHDPFVAAGGWPEGPAEPAPDLLAALAESDVVSIHAPKGDRAILGPAELARIRPGAIVVNTARGGVVDEAALVEALRTGRVSAAGVDVLADEPPRADDPLLAFDQVVFSPHIAGLTAESGERMAIAAVENVLGFFAGRLDPALVVNAGRARLRP